MKREKVSKIFEWVEIIYQVYLSSSIRMASEISVGVVVG